jgi:hypothetical protein
MFRATIVGYELPSHKQAELLVLAEALQVQLDDIADIWGVKKGRVRSVNTFFVPDEDDFVVYVTSSPVYGELLDKTGAYVMVADDIFQSVSLEISKRLASAFLNPNERTYIHAGESLYQLDITAPVAKLYYTLQIRGLGVMLCNWVYPDYFGGDGPFDHIRSLQEKLSGSDALFSVEADLPFAKNSKVRVMHESEIKELEAALNDAHKTVAHQAFHDPEPIPEAVSTPVLDTDPEAVLDDAEKLQASASEPAEETFGPPAEPELEKLDQVPSSVPPAAETKPVVVPEPALAKVESPAKAPVKPAAKGVQKPAKK